MGVREGKGETRGLTETEGCIIYLVMEQETQDSFNFRDERTDAVRAPRLRQHTRCGSWAPGLPPVPRGHTHM